MQDVFTYNIEECEFYGEIFDAKNRINEIKKDIEELAIENINSQISAELLSYQKNTHNY